ncbi:MAG: hydroxymethylpyrimidine/phosphomethylpyrimidine kinase [Pseudomonadota bacterium]|nr:MAG: hydroxymethylpyrimidine/phosphomethylpyrimidine kinase [Pseudomonadota bacterium]
MTDQPSAIPVVMTVSGLDPGGGAGIQADIEAIASMGCHAAPVVTALTVQDTKRLQRFVATDSLLLVEQARAVLEDMTVGAIKIGMVGSVAVAEVLHSLLVDYPDVPVVLDPVLAAGGGGELAGDETIAAVKSLLLTQTTILTPNSVEARALAHEADTLDACAQQLQNLGCEYVLITGAHEPTEQVVNVLYGNYRRLETFRWPRLPHSYHGSGCTLAAAIAGLLAQGREPFTAVHEAQEYAWETLRHGYRIGRGQMIPNRLFWARGTEEE